MRYPFRNALPCQRLRADSRRPCRMAWLKLCQQVVVGARSPADLAVLVPLFGGFAFAVGSVGILLGNAGGREHT